jgi:hypothetical protein
MSWITNIFTKKPKTKPYISLIGETIHPEHGIELSLDWSDEFVRYLKDSGYTGTSDELIIQKYMLHLYSDMAERIRERTNNVSDFQ